MKPNQYTHPWTNDELLVLKEKYSTMTAKELAKILGRTPKVVSKKARQLGLRAIRREGRGGRFWTVEEEQVIIGNYRRMPYEKIGEKIGRTKWAVRGRATKLGLTKHTHELPILNLTDLEKGYVAGIIDGEGTITITIRFYNGKYNRCPELRPLVEVANNNKEIIEKLKNSLGGSFSAKTYRYKGIEKPSYEWMVTGVPRSLAILREIAPHLIAKKKVAYALMEFCQARIRRFRQQLSREEIMLANQIRNMSGAKRPKRKNVLELLAYHQGKPHC